MAKIIKEPFAPKRRHFMMDYHRQLSGVNFLPWRLKASLVRLCNLAEAPLEDA
jgi:hypothetical protein